MSALTFVNHPVDTRKPPVVVRALTSNDATAAASASSGSSVALYASTATRHARAMAAVMHSPSASKLLITTNSLS